MIDLKKVLVHLRNNTSELRYDSTKLFKFFMLSMDVDDYSLHVYQNASRNMMYFSILQNDVCLMIFNIYKTHIDMVISNNNIVTIPDIKSDDSDWFNFNILYSGIKRESIYPEMDGLYELLYDTYVNEYFNHTKLIMEKYSK